MISTPRVSAQSLSIVFPLYNETSLLLSKKLVKSLIGGRVSRAESGAVTVTALDDVTAEFTDGDRVGLVGHNGAGKSTFLRALAGIYPPSSGSAIIRGTVSSLLELGAGLDTELNGYENIERMLALHGRSDQKPVAVAEDVKEFAELGDFFSLPVRTYSSGMIARFMFGYATSMRPDILLLDEVIGVGDSAFQTKARLRLEGLMDSCSVLILASHSTQIIEKYCNQVIRFESGKIIERKRL